MLLVLPTAMRISYAVMGLPPRPAVLSVSIPETFDDLRMRPKQFVCGHSNLFHVLDPPPPLPLPPRNISTKRSRFRSCLNFHVLAPLFCAGFIFPIDLFPSTATDSIPVNPSGLSFWLLACGFSSTPAQTMSIGSQLVEGFFWALGSFRSYSTISTNSTSFLI